MAERQSFPSSPVIRLPSRPYSPSIPIEVNEGSDYFNHRADKKDVIETVRPVGSADSDEERGEKPLGDPLWKPGFFSQFPVMGLGALVVALCCAAGSVITLMVSNGHSEHEHGWPKWLAPNVILSGLNSLANICYGIAIVNGIAIAWWRQTLKGATIQQLHKSWSFSTSLKEAVLAGKYFNFIALAALGAKLTIVDNMLMQKAFSTELATDEPFQMKDLMLWANESIPVTGYVRGGGAQSLLNQEFNLDLMIWQQTGGQIPYYGGNCDGICFVNVPAAGFEFDCAAPRTTKVDYGQESMTAESYWSNNNGSLGNSTYQLAPALFNVEFGLQSGPVDDNGKVTGASVITMDIVYTSANTSGQTCPGEQTVTSCVLRPAVVEYPVMILNENNGALYNTSHTAAAEALSGGAMTFDIPDNYFNNDYDNSFGQYNHTAKQCNGFNVTRLNNITEGYEQTESNATRLGGLASAFTEYLGGKAQLWFNGNYGYQFNQTGNAPQYLVYAPFTPYECNYVYADPVAPSSNANASFVLNSVMQSINQIMFTLATDSFYDYNQYNDYQGDYPDPTLWNATVYRESIHYQTHEPYMWGAFASMILCVLLILPVFWGYWQLGRKVSLNPVEIAHGFRSPMTAAARNHTVDELMKDVGQRQVKYGQIVAGDARGVLGIAEPEYVARVHPKIGSARQEISEKIGGVFTPGGKKMQTM